MNPITLHRNGKSSRGVRLSEIADEVHTLFQQVREAGEVQQHSTPGAPPRLAGFDIAAKARPWSVVNGDYYDFLPFPDGRVGLLVGDAAGKGMPAALLTSSLQPSVHALFEDSRDLAGAMARLNKATCRTCPANRFITLVLAVLDSNGELVYVNAGHNPPLIVHASGEFEALRGAGMVLGIHPEEAYAEGRAHLQPGDVLVLFSDGVTEASDARGQLFGDARLGRLVAKLRARRANQIVEAIHRKVAAFTRGSKPGDDITVVVARRTNTCCAVTNSLVETSHHSKSL